MRVLFCVFVGSFVWTSLQAQTAHFFRRIGGAPGSSEEMEVVLALSNGDLFAAGMTDAYSQTGDADGFVVVTDPNGLIRWAKVYGDTTDNMLIDAKELPGGGFLAGGWTLTDGTYDFWVVRLDLMGNVIWERRFGGAGDEQVWSVDVDSTGYLVVGGTTSFGAGLTDVWVLKLDTLGQVLWQRVYGTTGEDAPPGAYMEYVARGLISTRGHWMISGITDGAGQGGTDLFLIRISEVDGSVQWAYTYGQSQDDALWNFVEAENGNGYYLPGNTVDPASMEGDLWVVKVDTGGTLLWQKTFGIPGVWDEALNATPTTDGLVLASYEEVATQNWEATLLRVSGAGTLSWARSYKVGHLDWTNDAAVLQNGDLLMAGVTTDTTTWDQDLLLARLAADGQLSSCPVIGTLNLVENVTGAVRSTLPLQTTSTTAVPKPVNSTVQSVSPGNQVVCTGTDVGEHRRNPACSPVRWTTLPGGKLILRNPGSHTLRIWLITPDGRRHSARLLAPGTHILQIPGGTGVLRWIVEDLKTGQRQGGGLLTLP